MSGNEWTVYDSTNSGMPANSCGSIVKDKQNNLWVGVAQKGVVKFNGLNWTVYNDDSTGFMIHSNTSISIDSLNIKWVGYGGGLLKFNDTVWTRYHTGNSGIPGNGVISVFNKGNIVWVGTFDAGVGRFDGQTWTTYNVYNSGLPSNWIYMIKADLYNNIWFATRFGGVAKFNYIQNQWAVYNTGNSGIPNNHILSVYIDNNNVKWIGTDGLAIFNDTNWQVFSCAFIGSPVNFAKDRYGNLWICTAGSGLFVYNPAGVVGLENNTSIVPENFLFIKNYPNPFNPSTNIKYQIPKNSFVTLKIYNILGKEIITLVNEFKKVGTYEKEFSIYNFPNNILSSGIYFAVLKTDTKTKVHKIVLQK